MENSSLHPIEREFMSRRRMLQIEILSETVDNALYDIQEMFHNPSLTPIIVESCYYYTFSVLAMDSVSYKFLFF